uniref:Uncharacterized protein n=1 Tax=viral metagenome TaxID=1070528 RepID=A0A6C0JXT7_9ZZZZ
MSNIKTSEDIYNVSKYTDTELYHILDLSNPTDRELEARIYHLIKKYKTMDNESGNKLAQFFEDIYNRFFEVEEDEDAEKESFNDTASNTTLLGNSITNALPSQMEQSQTSASKAVTQMDYSKDYINPLLKQTITRVVSIDSQFRNNKKTTLSTNFSFNLSDTLRDVVAIRMNSIHIPKTWYTVSKSYGSNFFYIKGNSPGVNDGLHDYKIQIDPGNYNQTDLIAAINTSIANLKSSNTNIDFGNTGISYNSNTCIATMTTYVKSIYNETDYYLNFDYFTYPIEGQQTGVYTSIPALLGYNDQKFDLGTVHSVKDLSGTGHPTINIATNGTYLGYADNSDNFFLTANNNYFYVINYNGYKNNNIIKYGDPTFNDNSYNTIKITSSLPTDVSYTRLQLVTDFSAQIQNCIYLYPESCGIQRFYIDFPEHIAYKYSYFNFQLYLNKKTTTNAVNQKTVMVTPNDSKIWVGSRSCFHLDSSVNEISTIRASSEYSKSDFAVGNKVYFTVKCDASGYYHIKNGYRDFSKNDVVINLHKGQYILSDYINEINYAIRAADISNNHIFDPKYDSTQTFTNITGLYINSNSDYNLRMRFYINKKFSIDSYLLDCSSSTYFSTDLSMNYMSYDVSKNTNGICKLNGGKIFDSGSNYKLNNNDILFILKPNTTRNDISFGNYYADPYVVKYTGTTVAGLTATELNNLLNNVVQGFYDPILDDYPLSSVVIRHNITYTGYTYVQWSIDLSGVKTILNCDNYKIFFSDESTDNPPEISNTWSSYLYLDASYNLADYAVKYSNVFDVSYTDILNNNKIYKNLLKIKAGVNDTITLQAGDNGIIDVNGGNANDWVITIPPGTYSVNKLIDQMNKTFNSNTHWNGSYIYTKNNHVYFRINSGKVFNTDDYKLVFYDPYSFVKCFVGSSSVRNTSWDSTIGWILGYRELTEYILSAKYITPDVNNSNISYYGDTLSVYTYNTKTNVATLTGDTTVSVNLFNYFMIVLDDYTQNHLNDGLVTITPAENNSVTSYYVNKTTTVCDPITGKKVFTGTTMPGNNKNTEKQVYAANQKLGAQTQTAKIYSPGPFVQDIFALLPLNTSNLTPGSVYIDNGSGLSKQSRLYFGPVNISRMTIKLINDRGDVVDLNGSDWSCSLECDQLYQQKSL